MTEEICNDLENIGMDISVYYRGLIGEIWNFKVALMDVEEFQEAYRSEITRACVNIESKLKDLLKFNEALREDVYDILEKKGDRVRGD